MLYTYKPNFYSHGKILKEVSRVHPFFLVVTGRGEGVGRGARVYWITVDTAKLYCVRPHSVVPPSTTHSVTHSMFLLFFNTEVRVMSPGESR